MASGSQKFIARNRAPRVQIEYDVELYGSEKKVQLPFVMGVMADLAGKSAVAQPAIADRRFLEIDVDNFKGADTQLWVTLARFHTNRAACLGSDFGHRFPSRIGADFGVVARQDAAQFGFMFSLRLTDDFTSGELRINSRDNTVLFKNRGNRDKKSPQVRGPKTGHFRAVHFASSIFNDARCA